MAEEVTSALKLTAGDGITLVKGIDIDAGKLIINATNESNTKIYYHTFENNSYLGLQISDADCAKIFAEAAEANTAILIKITSSSSYGSSDLLYVYDGKYTPGGGVSVESYTELGFANSYINSSDSSVYTSELKIKRTGTEGSYSYSYQTLVGASGSGSSCPTTVYKLVFNTSAGKYVFDDLPANDIVDKANSSGNVIIYLVNPAGLGEYVFYQKRFWTSSGNQGVEFRTPDNSAKLDVFRTSGSSTWTWKFINVNDSSSNYTEKADLALNILRVASSGVDATYFGDFPTTVTQVRNLEGLYVSTGGGQSGGTTVYRFFICSSLSYTVDSETTRTYKRKFKEVNNEGSLFIATWTETNGVPSNVTWSKESS